MDLFIRNIESFLKAAKSGNERIVYLLVGGAQIGMEQGKLTCEQFECISQVAKLLLEDM